MKVYSDKQYVEIFHLLFLAQLGRKVEKRYYVLKGGCNLRFFFKSPRYSEDMDLDAKGIPVHKLEDAVTGILQSKPFEQVLAARGMQIARINNDKQTETTQRWKLGLTIPGMGAALPTKIEFSRRCMGEDLKFETVDSSMTAEYEMQPLMVNHYGRRAAFFQKIQALADRRETQARDIFDLHMLLGAPLDNREVPRKIAAKLAQAGEHVMLIDFPVFKSQVLAYLPQEDQKLYDADAWDAIRLRVHESLDEISR